MVGYFTRYLEFAGRGNKDVEQHWYLYEAIWRACQTLENVKTVEFQTTLMERALCWFIKWVEQNHNPMIDDIKRGFVKEFKVPQTDQQGLLELWEIKKKDGKTNL